MAAAAPHARVTPARRFVEGVAVRDAAVVKAAGVAPSFVAETLSRVRARRARRVRACLCVCGRVRVCVLV